MYLSVSLHIVSLSLSSHSLRSCVCLTCVCSVMKSAILCVTLVGTFGPVVPKFCSEEIVRTVESLGFVQYIFNCSYDVSTSVGSQACLSRFISSNNLAATLEGDCRVVYQALVNSWWSVMQDSQNCEPVPLLLGESLSSTCVQSLDHNGMEAFYESTGYYAQNWCSAANVRSYGLANAFDVLVSYALNSGPAWVPKDIACDDCYYRFATSLTEIVWETYGDESLFDECINGSEICLESTFFVNARKKFFDCAGWDIRFIGPVCDSSQVATVETLIPAPYYTFAECAYHPSTPFCSTIPAYFETIATDTGSLDCLACYTEFQSAIDTLAAAAEATELCAADVFAPDCLSYQQEALVDFETCAGKTLFVDPSTAQPPATTTTISTYTDTTSTTTTTTTTSKTGEICSVFAIAIFALFL